MGRQPYWSFGDVIRVDPEKNPSVPQPDDRRWLILSVAAIGRPWLTLFLGHGHAWVIAYGSMLGFVRVEDDE